MTIDGKTAQSLTPGYPQWLNTQNTWKFDVAQIIIIPLGDILPTNQLEYCSNATKDYPLYLLRRLDLPLKSTGSGSLRMARNIKYPSPKKRMTAVRVSMECDILRLRGRR